MIMNNDKFQGLKGVGMNRNLDIRHFGMKTQKGATMWSTLAILFMVGFLGLIAFKLIPIYMDHGIIRKSMQEIVNQQNFRNMTSKQILSAMQKRMIIDNIDGFDKDTFKVSRDKSGDKFITINYGKKVPIAGNVSAFVEFNEEVRTNRR